ncbi:MAG: hypothetical protein IPJ95_07065 [Gemmatimonadetes bacterium]|nr:hypothetical protein [Gemmatimonadota bacterium]MBK9066842.1 hypothetical protein [Gemmatimonadota bacterium]
MSPIVLAGAALALALVAIEWTRPDRASRPLRLALVLVAALALTDLARQAASPPAPPPAPDAAQALAFDAPDAVTLGEPVVVRGTLEITGAAPAVVVLADPLGPVDSATVTATAPSFRLTAHPRAVGGVVYGLAVHGAGLSLVESLGVAVTPPRPPALLILDGSPSFETAYLKRWLAARGARLALRTTLTRDRDRVERVNEPGTGPLPLTPATLGRYDAVLADAAALAALSSAERHALQAAVEEEGLGLLLTGGVPDAGVLRLFAGVAVVGEDSVERRVARPAWDGMPRRSRVGIELAAGAVARRAGVVPLIHDDAGRTLAARRQAGAGTVALTQVRAPSRWRLEGEDDLFAAYWSLLIGAVARDTSTQVRLEGAAPRADHRLEITLLGTSRPAAAVRGPDGTREPLALAQDPFDPRLWHGSTWPREAGWHTVELADRSQPFLVHPAPRRVSAIATEQSPRPRTILGFLLLLAALTALWVESRRRVGR